MNQKQSKCCIGTHAGEAKDPAAGDDPVYEYIPEDSRADIVMLETNVAYDRKPGERQHHVRTGITTEANVAYDWKPEDSRAAIMLEANVAYETKPDGRQDSRADIMTETNVAYDRKPDFIKGNLLSSRV